MRDICNAHRGFLTLTFSQFTSRFRITAKQETIVLVTQQDLPLVYPKTDENKKFLKIACVQEIHCRAETLLFKQKRLYHKQHKNLVALRLHFLHLFADLLYFDDGFMAKTFKTKD